MSMVFMLDELVGLFTDRSIDELPLPNWSRANFCQQGTYLPIGGT